MINRFLSYTVFLSFLREKGRKGEDWEGEKVWVFFKERKEKGGEDCEGREEKKRQALFLLKFGWIEKETKKTQFTLIFSLFFLDEALKGMNPKQG